MSLITSFLQQIKQRQIAFSVTVSRRLAEQMKKYVHKVVFSKALHFLGSAKACLGDDRKQNFKVKNFYFIFL